MGNTPVNEGELTPEERQELERLRQLAQRRRAVMNQVMNCIKALYNDAKSGEINFSAIQELLGLMIENPKQLSRLYQLIKTYFENSAISKKSVAIVIIVGVILSLFAKIFWEDVK